MTRSSVFDGAYAECEALARSHYENFPVASRLLPRVMRPHIAAVYAYARTADDIADEDDAPAAERLERLARWQRQLHEAVDHAGTYENPIITATAQTIHALDLPVSLFDDLISAFGQDTMTTRYDSWADVLDYCRRSANPIGRLVLRIAGVGRSDLDASSDALCTALQLTNFWQDFGRDWRAGRLYVPREVYAPVGATVEQLQNGALGDAWVRAIEECVRVTTDLFRRGRHVCDGVAGRLRYELRFTWLGGRRILDRVAARRDRLMTDRPALGAGDIPALAWGALRWNIDR